MYILFLLMVFHKSYRLMFFLSFVLSFSDWLLNDLSYSSLILSSWLSLVLKLSIEFFGSVTMLFSSRNSVCLFLIVSISLFMHRFLNFVYGLCSCGSLNFFERIILNSWSDNP